MSHKRLLLLAINALLLGGLAWAWLDQDHAVAWLPAEGKAHVPAPPAPPPAMVELPEAQRQLAWQHPLFSPGRQPDAAKAAAAQTLDGVRLSGVVVDGQASWALLRLADQRSLKLARGAALDSGWVLSQVEATSATFQRQGQARTLSLPVPRLPASAATPPITLPHVTAP